MSNKTELASAHPIANARAKWAVEQYARMSGPVRTFVSALYAVRDDRVALQHTFDTQRPNNKDLTLWEAAAIADVVRGLPNGWSSGGNVK